MIQERTLSQVEGGFLDWSKASWNDNSWRISRLKALQRLLSDDPNEAIILVDGFGTYLPDTDIALVKRDLGWGPNSKLLAEVSFDSDEEVGAWNELGTTGKGSLIEPSYDVCCRVLRPNTQWQQRVSKTLDEGDFVLRISGEGVLTGIDFRRTPPVVDKWLDGKPTHTKVCEVDGIDSIELLALNNAPGRNEEMAEFAGLILALLQQHGKPMASRGRTRP